MKKIILLLLTIFTLSSCDRDGDGLGVAPDFVPKNISFDFDSKLPSNVGSSSPEVAARIQEMKALTNMCGALMSNSMYSNRISTPLEANRSTLPNNYTWTSGNYVIDYNYGVVGKKYEFNYTVSINGTQYFFASGWQATDGNSGHWEADFGASSTNYNVVYDWNVNSEGDTHFEMDFNLGNTNISYIFNLNHDYSGDIEYNFNNTLTFSCVWDASGKGRYTIGGQTYTF